MNPFFAVKSFKGQPFGASKFINIFARIGEKNDPFSSTSRISDTGVIVQNSLSALWKGADVVYYYSMEVISDVMLPNAKNNAQNMPLITHGRYTHVHSEFSWENGFIPTLLRFQASASITTVNVRTCLCLCNCPVYTSVPHVVCMKCG